MGKPVLAFVVGLFITASVAVDGNVLATASTFGAACLLPFTRPVRSPLGRWFVVSAVIAVAIGVFVPALRSPALQGPTLEGPASERSDAGEWTEAIRTMVRIASLAIVEIYLLNSERSPIANADETAE